VALWEKLLVDVRKHVLFKRTYGFKFEGLFPLSLHLPWTATMLYFAIVPMTRGGVCPTTCMVDRRHSDCLRCCWSPGKRKFNCVAERVLAKSTRIFVKRRRALYRNLNPRQARICPILAEGAMTLPVTLSGGVLFAS